METQPIRRSPIPFENSPHGESCPFDRRRADHDFILLTENKPLPPPREVFREEDYSLFLISGEEAWRAITFLWQDGTSAALHTHSGDEPRTSDRSRLSEGLETFALKRIDAEEEQYLTAGALEFGILPLVEDESERTLALVQRMAGVMDQLQREFKGVVADLKQFALYGSAWSNPASPEYRDFLRFVNIHQLLTLEGIWAHTHGMAHFGKPDIEVLGAPINLEHEYAVWLLESCWHQAASGELKPSDSIEDPLGRLCILENASDVAGQKVGDHYLNDCLRVVRAKKR